MYKRRKTAKSGKNQEKIMIDIHSHIIPGLDDGAKDLDTALEMLEIAYNNGTSDVILTPHYIHDATFENNCTEIKKSFKELKEAAVKHGINLKLHLGSEIFICPELPTLLDEKKVLTLNNSSYVLVEIPMLSIAEYTEDVLFNLKLKGYNPIIAHPERCSETAKSFDFIKRLIDKGIYMQVNSSSIKGLFGKRIMNISLKLLQQGLVHFIASDAHTTGGRSPKLIKAYDIVAAKMGSHVAQKLFIENPQRVIVDKAIEISEPKLKQKPKRQLYLTLKNLLFNT